ncbi:MAG: hypothetical protein QOK29_3246, partial [Rhodospirillaceae bacterium]|nr:hypothetical protein [Rhodospirillaceae bacterium]
LLDKADVAQALDWAPLVEALEAMFRSGCEAPVRHHHQIEVPNAQPATLLLMPAWTSGGYIGVKIANVFPGNSAAGLPAVSSSYLLCSATTGQVLAVLDGGELTPRRTAAASALAARYLARSDASRLLIVGTGQVATHLAFAHAAQRPIRQIEVWGRTEANAGTLVRKLRDHGLEATVASDLRHAVGNADIISCATLSATPLVFGDWLSPGSHLDLVGGFTPAMREADDAAVTRSSVFVDTRAGALAEAGDIVSPIRNGVLDPDLIHADLHELTRGQHPGRTDPAEITFFKSVGTALEDLAAGILVYEQHKLGQQPSTQAQADHALSSPA